MKMKNKKIAFLVSLLIIVSFGFLQVGQLHAQSNTFGVVSSLFVSQMDEGDSGLEVTKLQTFLSGNRAIYPEGLVTGYFGPLTKAAVMRFQTAYGISAVGRVGPQTLAQLNVLLTGTIGTGGQNSLYDTDAPVVSGVVLNRTSSTATLQWNTNELTRNKVYYSTNPLVFYETTAPRTEPVVIGQSINDDIAFQSNFHSLGLVNLTPGTTYYYMIQSVDQNGNVSVTWPQAFIAL